MTDLIITGATVVRPDVGEADQTDIAISAGKVSELGVGACCSRGPKLDREYSTLRASSPSRDRWTPTLTWAFTTRCLSMLQARAGPRPKAARPRCSTTCGRVSTT